MIAQFRHSAVSRQWRLRMFRLLFILYPFFFILFSACGASVTPPTPGPAVPSAAPRKAPTATYANPGWPALSPPRAAWPPLAPPRNLWPDLPSPSSSATTTASKPAAPGGHWQRQCQGGYCTQVWVADPPPPVGGPSSAAAVPTVPPAGNQQQPAGHWEHRGGRFFSSDVWVPEK